SQFKYTSFFRRCDSTTITASTRQASPRGIQRDHGGGPRSGAPSHPGAAPARRAPAPLKKICPPRPCTVRQLLLAVPPRPLGPRLFPLRHPLGPLRPGQATSALTDLA